MLGVLFVLMVQEGAPLESPRSSEPKDVSPIHGRLTAKYRARWTGSDRDQDLYELLTLDASLAPEVTGALSARFAEDLDGNRSVAGRYVFDSLDDSYHRGSTARLYAAYVQYEAHGTLARIGRQPAEVAEAVTFDGISLREQFDGIVVSVFGGKPANLFESAVVRDVTGGAWIEGAPWPRGRVRLEYLHLEDENLFGLFRNDLVGLVLEQGTGPLFAWGRATALEGEARDATARLTLTLPELVVDAQGLFQFETIQALASGIDPYATFLLPVEPYAQATLRLSKSFGERFTLDLASTSRKLTSRGDEGTYNREFTRWSIAPRATLHARLTVSASFDFWQSTADDFWTLGGEAAWTAAKDFTLSAGSAFTLWTFDAFTGEERERVRSVYALLRWKLNRELSADVRASVERNDIDTFTTVEVGVKRGF